MYTFIIYHDNEEVVKFENQESDIKPCMYIQNHQGQSLNYALKHGGWKVKAINEETTESEFWQP